MLQIPLLRLHFLRRRTRRQAILWQTEDFPVSPIKRPTTRKVRNPNQLPSILHRQPSNQTPCTKTSLPNSVQPVLAESQGHQVPHAPIKNLETGSIIPDPRLLLRFFCHARAIDSASREAAFAGRPVADRGAESIYIG